MRHDDEHYLQLALDEAAAAGRLGFSPAGAVIVGEQGRIYAVAQSRRVPGNIWHAELRVLLDFQGADRTYGDRVTLYTVLEPCVMCIGVATMAKVQRIVWLLDDPWGGARAVYNPESPYIQQRLPVMERHPCPELAARAWELWQAYLGPYNVRKMFGEVAL